MRTSYAVFCLKKNNFFFFNETATNEIYNTDTLFPETKHCRTKGDVMFKASLLSERDGKVAADLTELDESRLPEGEVTVAVEYSTLNYKDGMVLNGLGRLVRSYPHVPGVDFAGTVEASSSAAWKPGDKVILTDRKSTRLNSSH